MANSTNYYIKKIFRDSPLSFSFSKSLINQVLDEDRLKKALYDAHKDVPFYSSYSMPDDIKDLSSLPILRKSVIVGHEKDFISRKVPNWMIRQLETGGTSGVSLRVYYRPHEVLRYNSVANYAFSMIGNHLRIAELRGHRPADNKISEKMGPVLLLSSYLLNEETLDDYLNELREHKITCLHVYPSSLAILCRLIRQKYGEADLPLLKGILASSEVFSHEDKNLAKQAFPSVKIVDFYGLNELCCAAVSVDDGPFRFFQNYGYVEMIDTGERIGDHKIAEIVATSIMNRTMPLIRYGTEDYAEIDENGEVVAILGRTSDFVVTKHKRLIPCIFINRDISFAHVVTFQYFQEREGELIFRVMVNDGFGKADIDNLMEDLQNSFIDVDSKVEVVGEMDKTRIGKQRRMVQKLDLNKYK